MRKLFVFVATILLLTQGSFAVGWGFGVRNVAMGGCGIATANDITAAYFNPAGLMYGPENFECQTFAGGTLQQITDLTSAVSDKDFLQNNFDQDLDINAAANAGLGFSYKKVGVSLLVNAAGSMVHPAISLTKGDIFAAATASLPITLGSTFSTPGIPIASLSVGVNLIPISIIGGGVHVGPTSGTGSKDELNGSGFAFDIGAESKITPLITVGAVIRNLSASVSTTSKVTPVSVAPDGSLTDSGPTVDIKDSYSPSPQVGLGLGVVVPLTGTLLACDLENYSSPDNSIKSETFNDIHLGVEQGMLFNIVMLRAGYFTYGATDDTYYTYGIGLNAGPASLGLAAANSVNDCNNSVAMAQLGVAF